MVLLQTQVGTEAQHSSGSVSESTSYGLTVCRRNNTDNVSAAVHKQAIVRM